MQTLHRPPIHEARYSILVAFALMASLSAPSQGFAQPAAPSSPLPTIIKAFSGHWKLTVKFEPASGFPAGTAGTWFKHGVDCHTEAADTMALEILRPWR